MIEPIPPAPRALERLWTAITYASVFVAGLVAPFFVGFFRDLIRSGSPAQQFGATALPGDTAPAEPGLEISAPPQRRPRERGGPTLA